MNIEQNWKQQNEQGDEDLSGLLQPGKLKKLHSSGPLQKIKDYLLISFVFALLVAAFYVYVMFLFPQWPVLLCVGIVLLFNLWAGYTAWQQYKTIEPAAQGPSLLAQLQKHHDAIHAWMKTQLRVAIFVYPVAATGGFMVGGMEGSGKSIAYFMGKPVIQVTLLITLAVLVPLCIWLAKWMFKKTFGRHLARIRENMEALKNPAA
jgi:hypothetical protein